LGRYKEAVLMVLLTLKIRDWFYSAEVKLPAPAECPAGQVYDPVTKACIPIIPEVCTIGEEQTVQCPDGSTIVTSRCEKDIVTGKNRWTPTGKVCPPPIIPEICEIGDEQTVECPDGSILVTARCEKDIVTGKNRWTPTGKVCPPPIIPEICNIGEEQKLYCPDGSTVITSRCEKDPVTGKNRWTPTGKTCPPPPPTEEFKIVTILPQGEPSLPDANEGQKVYITAVITCKKKETTTYTKETAYLVVDGAIVDQKMNNISDGSVSFEWIATAIPVNIHTICVQAQPSSGCKGIGSDCKKITVSPTRLEPSVQLATEREAASEQRSLLTQSRTELRKSIIEEPFQTSIPTVPTTPTTPTMPTTPTVPTTPTTTTPTVPTTPTTPGFGSIQIIGFPIDISPVTPAVYVYLDGVLMGQLYTIPTTIYNVSVGTHTIYASYGGINTIQKTVDVSINTVSTVIL
jgi:hypothetical protein